MAVVNIPRDVKDEFYRYKIPALIAKVEGRGNGIKTVIVNMSDIAKSLARPPEYPTKYFGFELGSITTIEQDKDKYVVNGKHDQSKLAQVLDDFIEKFILCKKCQRNPETYMTIKGGVIELKCKACGGRSPVDMRHKLCTFILKNPPPAEKEERKLKTVKKKESSEENGADQTEEGNGKQEEKKSSRKKKKQEEDEDDVVWYTDTSKEAAEQRRKNMLDNTSELAAKLLSTGISDRPDPLVEMNTFLETKPSNASIIAQLKKLKGDFKLDDEQAARLTFLSLFSVDIFKQLKTNRLAVLKEFVPNVEAQNGILAAITELGKEASVLKLIPHVLKHLYDEDVLEEMTILKWYGAKSRSSDALKVKEASKVFVEWLENADEESEEEDEDEEDEEEEEKPKKKDNGKNGKAAPKDNKKKKQEEEDDEGDEEEDSD